MQALLHIVFLCGYAGLAGAAVVFGPRWLPWLEPSLAFGLGGLVLLGGALLHEIYARTGRQAYLGERVHSLSYGYADQQDELAWMRREVEALRQALDAASQSGQVGPVGRTVEEVMAEVKVLKSLIPRLSVGQVLAPEPEQDGAADPAGRRTTGADLTGGIAAPAPGVLPPVAENLGPDAVLDAVRAALRDDRIDLVLQPIVSLPQRKRRFYECFSRLRTGDGAMILPDQYITIAERTGLITAIDNMLLFRCVQLIRKVHRKSQDVGFFCNISPHTLTDVDFFSDFIDLLASNQGLAPHLIFEFAQADFARWSEAGARLLDRLAVLGCRFSLDRVRNLNLDPAVLAARQIRFVKIETDLLLKDLAERVDLFGALRRHHIDLIAEKIEDETALLDLLDYEIDFGQGYLFGEPRLARPAT
ncbi:MAG: EAL domain-containing protein [Kiloniellaceae bacterium]